MSNPFELLTKLDANNKLPEQASKSWADVVDSDSENDKQHKSVMTVPKKPIDPKKALAQKYAPLKLSLYTFEDLQTRLKDHIQLELIERRFARQLPDRARKHLEKVVLKRVFQIINTQMCTHYSALDVFGMSTSKEFNCKLITIEQFEEVKKYALIFKFPLDTIPKLDTMIDAVDALLTYDPAGTVIVNGAQYCYKFE